MSSPKHLNQSPPTPSIPEALRTLADRLCQHIAPHAALHASPAGKELAKRLQAVLSMDCMPNLKGPAGPHAIIGLAGLAEQEGHLPPGTAAHLLQAKLQPNPYLTALRTLAFNVDVAVLDPDIRTHFPHRPSALQWAIVADILAEEVRRHTPQRVWPVVSALLARHTRRTGSSLHTQPDHLRRFVDRWKRQFRKDFGPEAWQAATADFRRRAE